MAFADLGSLCSGGSSGNNQTSLTVATTATANAGELVVVAVTDDNRLTTGGDDLATSGVTIGGTAMTKALQNAVAPGGVAQAGASVSLWYLVLVSQVVSGANIIATFTGAAQSDATALSARRFSMDAGSSVNLEATNSTTSATTNPGSLNATTGSHECLRVRAIGCEFDSTMTFTVTSTWTAWVEGASAATGTITEQVIEVEHLISTGTGAASAPTLGSTSDNASVYAAFQEIAGVNVLMGQAVL